MFFQVEAGIAMHLAWSRAFLFQARSAGRIHSSSKGGLRPLAHGATATARTRRSFLNSTRTTQATTPPTDYDMAVDQDTADKKQTILHINASITPDSVTARVATAMVDHLTHHYHRHHNTPTDGDGKPENPEDVLVVEEFDVWSDKLPKFDKDTMQRVWRARNDSQDEADIAAFKPIQELAVQLVRADFLVVTVPVWNFSIPYVLKQYIDCIVQPGLTFRNADAEGPSRPFFTGKPIIIISSSGGKLPPPGEDFVYPFISKIFAMCGFDEAHHVAIVGLANHDKKECYDNAVREANEIADQVVRSHKLRLEANAE